MAGELIGEYLERTLSIFAHKYELGPGFSNNTTLTPYGAQWRKHRKLMNRALNFGTVQRDYAALQEWKTRSYLYDLLQHPDRVIDSIGR